MLKFLNGPISVVNVGIETLVEHLPMQGVEVVHVDWKPPAGGNLELLKKIRKLNKQGRSIGNGR